MGGAKALQEPHLAKPPVPSPRGELGTGTGWAPTRCSRPACLGCPESRVAVPARGCLLLPWKVLPVQPFLSGQEDSAPVPLSTEIGHPAQTCFKRFLL